MTVLTTVSMRRGGVREVVISQHSRRVDQEALRGGGRA